MKITEFINAFKSERFVGAQAAAEVRVEFLKKTLEIKTYIPFREKRKIVEMIVEQNIEEIDGIKKYDSINAYLGLIIATLVAHTNLEFSDDPIVDYDLLAECGVLPQIIFVFKDSYDECGTLLKMAVASELEDNNANVLIGHFLDSILKKVGSLSETLSELFGDFDLQDLLDADFTKEGLAKITGFLNRDK
jgi:hypothetical protein